MINDPAITLVDFREIEEFVSMCGDIWEFFLVGATSKEDIEQFVLSEYSTPYTTLVYSKIFIGLDDDYLWILGAEDPVSIKNSYNFKPEKCKSKQYNVPY